MSISVRRQALYWGIAALVFVLALWFLGNTLLPFVLGGAIAYLLDPLADRLQRLGLSRVASVAIISIGAVVMFILLVLTIIPTLIAQAVALVEAAPGLIQRLTDWLSVTFPAILDETSTARAQLNRIAEALQSRGGEVFQGVLTGALGFVNALVLLVVVPVVAFYLLLDWDRMVAKVDELLPREHATEVRGIASEIDRTLASFLRGQGLVCVILGTFYATALALTGLNFGLVIGAIAGLVTFIPYVGALIGGALAIGIALFQFWGDWAWIGLIGGIFAFGQFIEGNVLTPKLVGESVGLHPVWLIFALSVFGALFGFVGLLVAVPVAAMLGVIVRYLVGKYKDSALYQGPPGRG